MAATKLSKYDKAMDFGLIFFSSSEAPFSDDKYRLVIESAKFADRHGFSSIWIPERHFTRDGWLYPNPAVLQAAIARETSQLRLRAGSVVMPLHNPIRVAEEWAMVDNLSGGRVDLSFASGWHPNDFVFFPENYTQRQEEMYRGIQTVQKLWRGEAIQVRGGDGKLVEVKTYPTPIQSELPIWITAAGNPKTFAGAGAIGAGLLTHMYNHDIDELAEKIRIYREALAKHGYDPQSRQVSVMLHTFIGEDAATVRAVVEDTFCTYLKSASYLLNAIAYSRGQKIDVSSLSEQDLDDYMRFVFERLVSTQRVLIGTPETCFDVIAKLKAAGVDEIACQLDFGLDADVVLSNLPYLEQLKDRFNAAPVAQSSPMLVVSHEDVNTPKAHANGSTAGEHAVAPDVFPYTPSEHHLLAIQRRCQQEVAMPAFYDRLRSLGVQLGTTFQGIERLWRRDGEALGKVRLLETVAHEADYYQIHPTLLDASFQVLIATLSDTMVNSEDALYLPTGLRSFQMHRRPGKQVWSHAVLKPGASQAEGIFEGDVYLLDEDGQVLVEACGLQLYRSEAAIQQAQPVQHEETLDDWLYELRWEPASFERPDHPVQAGQWLVFADNGGVGRQIAKLLEARGETCALVFPGDAYQVLGPQHYQLHPASSEEMHRLIKDVLASGALPWRGVLHLWSLNATSSERTSVATLEADAVQGVGSALHVIQALLAIEETQPPGLWFITRGAQSIGQHPLAVAQSPLWGLGRTCAMEHPELWGGLVDLDPQGTIDDAAAQLLDVMAGMHKEDQVAFRQQQGYVARMVHTRALKQQPLTVRSDVSYLITGGLWGLGLEVAHWLVGKGARHLVLLGRTQLPPRTHWDALEPASRLARQVAGMRALEAAGAHVYYAAVDVAHEEQLTTFFHDFARQAHPPIKGVVHAASVWQDAQGQSLVRPLANLTTDALHAVFQPKVMGSWLLYTLLKDSVLDFFVSFSSGASLFGSAAQGNYAAAGTFLDALAHHMRAEGQHAISIDWGAVSEIGFGATPEGQRVHEYWESHGIQRINPRQVLAALELLIPQSIAQVGVIKLDWHLLQQFYPQIAHLPLVSYLVAESDSTTQSSATAQATSSIMQRLRSADSADHLRLLEAYLSEQVASVLRVSAARLDAAQPLTTLGLDSLMAIELKNRLEQVLNVRIPIVTFLQGPSIAQFSAQMLDQVTALISAEPAVIEPGDQHTGTIDQQDAEQLLSQLDQLSDEEVSSLLGQMLQEENGQSASIEGIDQQDTTVATTNGLSSQDAEQLLSQLDQLSDNDVASLLTHIVQKEEFN